MCFSSNEKTLFLLSQHVDFTLSLHVFIPWWSNWGVCLSDVEESETEANLKGSEAFLLNFILVRTYFSVWFRLLYFCYSNCPKKIKENPQTNSNTKPKNLCRWQTGSPPEHDSQGHRDLEPAWPLSFLSCRVLHRAPFLALLNLGPFLNGPYPSPVLPHTIVYAGQAAHRVHMHPIPSPPPPQLPPPHCSDTCLWAALPKSPPSRSWGLSPAPLALATVLQLLMPVLVLSGGRSMFYSSVLVLLIWSITKNCRCFLRDCWVNEWLD